MLRGVLKESERKSRRLRVKGKLLWSIFLALVAVFLLLFIAIFVPIQAPPNFIFLVRLLSFIVPCALLLLLGLTLIILTMREKIGRMPRAFLLLTGASAAMMVVSIVLHNVMGSWLGVEEPVSYIVAVFVCPIAFLVGGVGSVVLGLKKSAPRRRKR
jgi:hypothetical protein